MSSWILLRGLTREARHWGDVPERIAARWPGAATRCIDLPGNGRRHADASPVAIAPMLAAVRSEATARGLAPPYHLLALSLGGLVAIEWAVQHPRELAGAVLVNTSVRPFAPGHRRLRPGAWPTLLRLLLDAESDAEHERLVLALTSAGRGTDAGLLADWIVWRRECRVTRLNALRQIVAAVRYRAPAAAPPVPWLVLAGAGDRLVDPRCSLALAQRWGAAFALHPHAGHDLPLDDAPWLVERVAEWLQADTASASAGPSSVSI
jgi:pimeloyl-ACP methyl ester carboxylesterase